MVHSKLIQSSELFRGLFASPVTMEGVFSAQVQAQKARPRPLERSSELMSGPVNFTNRGQS
jgi:hypothetical protein